MSPAIRLRGVEYRFASGLRALASIDLEVGNGEFTTLLGPSGCGKSTLLRIVAGLLSATAGTVESTAASGDIAYVFQHATLMPWASVHDNVALPFRLLGQKVDRARVHEVLRHVGLGEFSEAYPRELSGGMQMRVSIARALVTRPRLLLMDEPFAALDEITRHRLDSDLHALWERESLTVLFVTHSVQEAVFLSQRVLVMSARPGRITGEARIDEVVTRDADFRLSDIFLTHARTLSRHLAHAETGSST